MVYAILAILVLVIGGVAYFKLKGSSLKSEQAKLEKQDQEASQKVQEAKVAVDTAQKELDSVKPETLTPDRVEDYWSKK